MGCGWGENLHASELFDAGFKNLMFFAVIDEKEKETLSEHDTQLASIRWHLAEGIIVHRLICFTARSMFLLLCLYEIFFVRTLLFDNILWYC